MFRVIIKNRLTQEEIGLMELPTEELLAEWIAGQEVKGDRGFAFGRYYGQKLLPKMGLQYDNEEVYDERLVEEEYIKEFEDKDNELWVKLYPEYEISDPIDTSDEQQDIDDIVQGAKDEAVCKNVLRKIGGRNRRKNFSLEQITQMQESFSTIESALRSNRPDLAKIAINSVTPDGEIVTQELKDKIISMLS